MGNPNVRFLGFDAVEDRKRYRRFVVEPDDLQPQIHTYHDVVVFPGLDALYDRDGKRIDISKRNYVPPDLPGSEAARLRVAKNDETHCPESMAIPEGIAVLDVKLLYLGVFWAHFGHFLMDSMSRLWALGEGLSCDGHLFLGNEKDAWRKQSYGREIFDALGFEDGRLLRPEEPVMIRTVLVPEPSIQHAFRIYACHDRSHVAAARAILSRSTYDQFRGARAYLSRSKLPPGVRRLEGEDVLEGHLARHGFRVLYPEQMTMAEQIALFNQASHIAGSIGSAFHTSLFIPKVHETRLSILSWQKINNRYLMVDSLKNYEAIYINCCAAQDIDDRERITSMVLDVDLALDCILGGVPPQA